MQTDMIRSRMTFARARASVVILFCAFLFATSAPLAHARQLPMDAAPRMPVAEIVRPDGTLDLTQGVNGALDLNGWNVTLDPAQGPVFAPEMDGAWSALGTGRSASVFAIGVSGSEVYAGGDWINNIAKWNGSSWSTLGTGMNARVRAIAVSASVVYAGGDFTTAGGVTVNRIAKWDGTSWSALGTGMDGIVYAIAVSGTDVYAGGAFTTAGGVTVNRIAKWDGTSWSALGLGADGNVLTLAASGSEVYAGGSFVNVDGVPNANYIAKWNGSNWFALGTGMNSTVYALATSGSDVYAGGAFSTAGGVAANNIARWNGNTGNWLALGAGTNGSVRALTLSGSDVCAGGFFTSAGGAANTTYIAAWDGSSWSSLGSGLNAAVYAIAVSGGNVYAGGAFTDAGGDNNADYIARFTPGPTLVYAEPAPGNCGGNTPCYNSLQGAIDAVVGSEVRYYGGTYSESVALNKNATLNFVGSSNVTIGGALAISAGTFNAPSAHTLALTGNLTNSGGTFDANGGTFSFAGSGTQTVSGDFSFHNLTVNSGATVDVGSSTLTVNGTLTNAGTIRGVTTQNVTLDNEFTFNDATGHATAILYQSGGTAMGNTTLEVRANTTTAPVCGSSTLDGTPVKRYFDFTPTNNANVTVDLTLYYYDGASNSEANGNTLDNIVFYHCNGTAWARLTGTYTTGIDGNYKWVLLNNYTFTSFSPFAMGNAPTATTLVNFSVRFNPTKSVVRARWETGSELNVIGFNLWRKQRTDGNVAAENDASARSAWKKLNAELIPAKHPGDIGGDHYARRDRKVSAGKTYFYKLEILRADGTSEWSDVIRVRVP